ncbi:histone H3, partial [Naegleria gruberi]
NEKRKRKQRWLQEIRKYQKSTRNLIPRASLIRLIKQVTAELSEKIPYIRQLAGEGAIRWRKDALAALHSAAEDFLHEFLTLSNYATLHAKRVTLMGRDLKLVQNINREH